MKKLVWGILILLFLSACTGEAEEVYSVEDAKKNGDVVVQHRASSFDQIVQGAIELENVDQLIQFENNVENKEKASSVTISIFDMNGEHFKNTLTYEKQRIIFNNEYGGYKGSAEGKFTCEYIQRRGPIIYVESCVSDDGREISTLLAFVGTEEAFRQAENQ